MEPLNRTGLALVQTVSDMALSNERTEPRQPQSAQTVSTVRSMEPLNRTGLALVQTVSDMALSDERTEPRQPQTVSTPSPSNFFDYLKDLFFGPTKKDPLHNPSSEKELREALKKASIDVNTLNSQQHAPIHSLVKIKAVNRKERLKKMSLLVTLLTYGDVDVDKTTGVGETALHIATKNSDHTSVKVLIAFGAKVNVLNRASLTPLDHVQGPQRFYYHTDDLEDFVVVTPLSSQQDPLSPTGIPPSPKRICTQTEGVDSPHDQVQITLSPSATPPPPKRMRSQVEEVDSTTEQLLPNEASSGSALDVEQSVIPPVQQAHLTIPLQSRPLRERSVSWSSLTVPPQTTEQPSSTREQLQTDSPAEVPVGNVRVSQTAVSDIANTLQSAGGNRSKRLPRVDTTACVPKFKRFIHEEDSASMGKWSTSTLPWYYSKLENVIEQRLANISVPLTDTPDEAMALAVQMREMRMYQRAGSRILFLDGGGMRGLLQIEILSQIERHTGRKITELFDWIVGTSTGGMVALGLVYAKKSLSDLRKFYFRARDDVFQDPKGGVSYDSDALENLLKDQVGTEMRMNDVTYPRVIIPATYKKNVKLQTHFFNNCFDDDFSKQLVWKVARYTSAGPVYFTESDNYVDGGILAQNPSTTGLTVIQQYFKKKGMKLPISLVVSVGSGQLPSDVELGNVDATEYLYFGPHWFNLTSHLSDRIKCLTTLLGNALGESEMVSENCRSRCQEQRIAYYRFNPQLKKVIPAGETNLSTLINMILAGRKLTTESPQFAEMIVRFHGLAACNHKMVVQCNVSKEGHTSKSHVVTQ